MEHDPQLKAASRCVHAGYRPPLDGSSIERAVVPPLTRSSTFLLDDEVYGGVYDRGVVARMAPYQDLEPALTGLEDHAVGLIGCGQPGATHQHQHAQQAATGPGLRETRGPQAFQGFRAFQAFQAFQKN